MTTTPTNGRASLQLVLSIAAVGFVVLGAFIWVGRIASQVEWNAGQITAQQRSIDHLNDDRTELASFRAKTCQQLGTVEVQVGSIVDDINIMKADDLRFRGLIYPKIFGEPYPDQFYNMTVPDTAPVC